MGSRNTRTKAAASGAEDGDSERGRELLHRFQDTLADPPTTGAVLLLTENLLGILLAGGLDPQDAASACDIFRRVGDGRRP
jgi:hypothetical protein